MRVPSLASLGLIAAILIGSPVLPEARAQQLRIYSSPALGQLVAAAIPRLRETGVDAAITGEASSTEAIHLLAAGRADAAFTIRALTGEDRAIAPEKPFFEVRIGTQATALLVSRDVWEAGLRSVTKEQLRQIYEREITDWKRLGGPDRPIRFFNYTHGQGIWEHFAQWMYGEIRRAPLGNFEMVVSADDARSAVEFNGGSATLGSPLWADGREIFAVALAGENGAPVAPTRESILDRTYPLSRPLMLLFDDRPNGPRGRMRDYFLSKAGQDLVLKRGFIPLGETPAPSATSAQQ